MPATELFAVCHVNDVAKRGAVGFVLARREGDKTVPFPIFVVRQEQGLPRLRQPLPASGRADRLPARPFPRPGPPRHRLRQAWGVL